MTRRTTVPMLREIATNVPVIGFLRRENVRWLAH